MNSQTNIVVPPRAFNVLSSFKEQKFDVVVQHPLSIWNTSFTNVKNRLIALLESLEVCVKTDKRNSEILPRYENLLTALCQLWEDDTTEILKAFTDEKRVGKLEEIKAFNEGKKRYLTHYSKIINKIKHNQRMLLGCNAYVNGKMVPGFFVGRNAGDKWEPCPEVHYRKGDDAFSFYYEMRRVFTGLYVHGSSLAQLIEVLNSVKWPHVTLLVPEHSQDLADLAIRIYSLPNLFFPNELSRPLPLVEETPALKRITQFVLPTRLPPHSKVTMENVFSGDGVTRTFKMIELDWNKYNHLIGS